jgi:hypothetical protein
VTGGYDLAIACRCKEKGSYIRKDILTRNNLWRDNERYVRLTWVESSSEVDRKSRSICTLFRVVSNEEIEHDVAIGTKPDSGGEEENEALSPPIQPDLCALGIFLPLSSIVTLANYHSVPHSPEPTSATKIPDEVLRNAGVFFVSFQEQWNRTQATSKSSQVRPIGVANIGG